MIRLGKLKDFKKILIIFKEVQNLHAENEPEIFKFTDPINSTSFKEMLKKKEIKIFVSENNKEIDGFLIGKVIETESNLTLPRKLFAIETLAVLKKSQKKNIGKNLISTAKSFANKEKCDGLILSVWSFNENAFNFYKHLGFEEKSIKMELKI